MRIVLLGPPGVGKGTIATTIRYTHEIPHISTGDMFRDEIKKGTELGKKFASYIHEGHLVPDDLVIACVKARIEQADCNEGFILDGFPRTLEQAQVLHGEIKIDEIIHLFAYDETVVERITGRRVCEDCAAIYHQTYRPSKEDGVCDYCSGRLVQREDDKEGSVRKRLEIHCQQIRPIIDFFSREYQVIDIYAGLNDRRKVKARILKALFGHQNL
ncbi:adenylate kinase [Candidatus Woesearchaeota archaeon]|nr:adenylate kinase [Candidatus Woesearchaeota archaeon]